VDEREFAEGKQQMNDPSDRRLLCISEVGCGPPFHGNRTRMKALLEACRILGYEIHFAGVNMSATEREGTEPYVDKWVADFVQQSNRPSPRSIFQRIGGKLERTLARVANSRIPIFTSQAADLDRLFCGQWLKEAAALQHHFGYKRVLVAYVFHSAFFKAFPGSVRRVLDCHDVFTDRNQRLASMGGQGECEWFSVSEQAEVAGLLRANVILGIQHHESAYFREILRGQRVVRTVGHLRAATPLPFGDESEHVVGFIAGPNPLNVDAFKYLSEQIWPRVLEITPSAKLLIAGGICDLILPPARSVCLGQVNDLADFYRRVDQTVNPVRAGTGLKIKTVESLAHGRVCVTTAVGAEGIESLTGSGLLIASTSQEFAAKIARGCEDRVGVVSAGRKAASKIAELNARYLKELQLALDG